MQMKANFLLQNVIFSIIIRKIYFADSGYEQETEKTTA